MMATPHLILLAMFLSAAFLVHAQRPTRLERLAAFTVKVAEPSDLARVPGTDRFFLVSDNGFVAEIDAAGNLVRRSAEVATDLEGMLVHEGTLLLMDEMHRQLLWVNTPDLAVERRMTFPYAGGRNKGYEAIAFNEAKQRLLLITERDPVLIHELDAEYRVINEVRFDPSVRDISSAQWHNDHLWLLSNMDMLFIECDPHTYAIERRFLLDIINPEGFAIDADGTVHVVSDDRQRMYRFKLPAP